MARTPILSLLFLTAMSTAAQQEAVVHQFLFHVDEELTTSYKVDDKSRNWFPGYSTSEAMPQSLIDSIKTRTEEALSKKLGIPVKMCYKESTKDAFIQMSGGPGMIPGLPGFVFKKGKEVCPDKHRYVDIGANIYASGGASVDLGGRTKTKLKPKVTLDISVYDVNKEEVWGSKVALKDFDKLRSETRYYGSKEVTKAETLTPYDIYAMYLMALEEAMLK